MSHLDHFPTAYTPLESLLLFQALRVDGVHPGVFNRISTQLQQIPLIRNDPSFNPGRLSPDALRELYLRLLKEEVKQDLERQANTAEGLLNGDTLSASKKRKISSPNLPTVHEAAQHAHLIPQLVTRLYARYRDNIVRHLREQERLYQNLTREIDEIQSGQWDERLQRQREASAVRSPKPSSSAHTQPNIPRPDHLQPAFRPVAAASPSLSQTSPVSSTSTSAKNYSQAKIDAVIHHDPQPEQSSSGRHSQSSNTSLPPLSEMAPESPSFGMMPKPPGPMPPHGPPIPPTVGSPYGQASPIGRHPPFPPPPPSHAHSRPGSMSNPQMQQSLSRASASPRPMLPPLTGMQPSPVQPNGSPHMLQSPLPHHLHHPQHYQPPQHPPQYAPHRLAAGPSPQSELLARGYAGQQPPQHAAGYYPQSPYPDRRTSFQSQQQPPPFASPVPPNGGYPLPPFAMTSPDLAKSSQQQPIHVQQASAQSHRPLPFGLPMQGTPSTAPPRHGPRGDVHLLSRIVTALATPTRQKSKVLWKSDVRPSTHSQPVLQQSPAVEPLSPTTSRALSPTRGSGHLLPTESLSIKPFTPTTKQSAPRGKKKRQTTRDRSPHSVVSSTADDLSRARTRSHSVSTVVGTNTAPDDRPGSKGDVKDEPFTPAEATEDGESVTAASTTSASGPMTRKRRGTLQSTAPTMTTKRKRQESPNAISFDPEDLLPPIPRSDKVAATRNFARMASALLNNIHSHKNAYRFDKPVRDKEAPGYSAIVHQPQDLKSIRAAISAGTKAVALATSAATDSPAASGAVDSMIVELDRTIDVIPPKAIVNGAQLERELMRMFANAFMFNPGEDGVAGITKEFFEDCEQKINDWRNIEKNTATSTTGTSTASVDGDEDSKGKRRRVV